MSGEHRLPARGQLQSGDVHLRPLFVLSHDSRLYGIVDETRRGVLKKSVLGTMLWGLCLGEVGHFFGASS